MIDLRKEQKATLLRKRYRYSLAARFFFFMMDIVTGRKTTLAKAKLIEALASVPYRAWEIRQYRQMTGRYGDGEFVRRAFRIVSWGREAQDNEYWHLRVIDEKMREDGVKDPWFLAPAVRSIMVNTYAAISSILAAFNISRAFLFNAEFEDHAEHVYARFVEDHPELDSQPVGSAVAEEYGDFESWGDLFRRIGLDERDHMNNSFLFCGKPEAVVRYQGMPELPEA
ncbi:MAG: hypothetical protein JW814_09150 [Candidatus Krumholzibacteriota bacterium]|nr:hypothetical protein [Candidatus Krumholzibacteriota bacterium]